MITQITLEPSFDHLFATYSYTSYWQIGEFLTNTDCRLSYLPKFGSQKFCTPLHFMNCLNAQQIKSQPITIIKLALFELESTLQEIGVIKKIGYFKGEKANCLYQYNGTSLKALLPSSCWSFLFKKQVEQSKTRTYLFKENVASCCFQKENSM